MILLPFLYILPPLFTFSWSFCSSFSSWTLCLYYAAHLWFLPASPSTRPSSQNCPLSSCSVWTGCSLSGSPPLSWKLPFPASLGWIHFCGEPIVNPLVYSFLLLWPSYFPPKKWWVGGQVLSSVSKWVNPSLIPDCWFVGVGILGENHPPPECQGLSPLLVVSGAMGAWCW